MKKTNEIKTEGLSTNVKKTLQTTNVPIYDWMFETGLHQCDLLVYAAIFDILRNNPCTPKHINLADVAKRIHYTRHAVYGSIELLVNHQFLHTQGERRKTLFSLYPFPTLDLQ